MTRTRLRNLAYLACIVCTIVGAGLVGCAALERISDKEPAPHLLAGEHDDQLARLIEAAQLAESEQPPANQP